jgi:hypothetical protein
MSSLQEDQKRLQGLIVEMLTEPQPARQVIESLVSRGFSLGQLRTAKRRLNVTSRKSGGRSGWIWQLPNTG